MPTTSPSIDPMAPTDVPPRLLDSGQFAVIVIGLALLIVLTGVIAVGSWGRGR